MRTFAAWEYEKASKRKGGRVSINVRSSGEVSFHEGYVSRKEARRADKGISTDEKSRRPEVTSTMQTYIDLHRHAAVRVEMAGNPAVVLRLMVAHVIAGSHLFRVTPEPQTARSDEVRESVETCPAEAAFDEKRRAVLGVLGFDPDTPTVCRGHEGYHGLVVVFLRLLDLPDPVVMEVVAMVMGEALASGSAAVEAVGAHLQVVVDSASNLCKAEAQGAQRNNRRSPLHIFRTANAPTRHDRPGAIRPCSS